MPTVSESSSYWDDKYDNSKEKDAAVFAPKKVVTPTVIKPGEPQTSIGFDELNTGPGNPEMRMH